MDDEVDFMSTVRIGEAAALYDLAPSAVRWWERQGVLAAPDREGRRRRYSETDLRRLGLAYLCRVTGMMPLASAAIVTSDKADFDTWQRTIQEQAARLEQEITQLTAARDYLRVLLSCKHDDPALCPMLDDELTRHTPRGRVPGADLVSAARLAAGREGMTGACDEKTACPMCGRRVRAAGRGRPRRYCSRACQQRAYRVRRRV